MLLPHSEEKLLKMKADIIVRLLADLPAVAEKLVALKATFPNADVSQMISRQPDLVLTDKFGNIGEACQRLSAILPGLNVDRYVCRYPTYQLLVQLHYRCQAEGSDVLAC